MTTISRSKLLVAGAAFIGASFSANANVPSSLPTDIQPGECYTKALVPARYKAGTTNMLVREAGQRIEITPARYKTVTERVMSKEGSTRFVKTEAVYRTEAVRVLVKPEGTEWKLAKGDNIYAALSDANGKPITRIDSSTGDTLCRVRVPAQYRTITVKKLVKPATVREVTIDPEYSTVTRRVLAEPATKRVVEIPAEYREVNVSKKISDATISWVPVLCQTNMTKTVVTDLQQALKREGYYAGPIDGIIGSETVRGLGDFQKDNNLTTGGLTRETMVKLGITVRN